MSGTLSGRVAVITGGTTGIGLAIASRFASEGAHVFLTGRRQAELDAAATSVGYNAVGIRADMSDLADIQRLFDEVSQHHARIDILVANAGGGEFAPLGSITEEHYTKTFDTNVKGVLFSAQMALPLLGDGGAIILTGSTAGSGGIPAFSVYSATKAAVRNFARGWALDLKDRGIRVNVISPGPIDTPGLHGLGKTDEEAAEFKAAMASSVPLGRLGQPSEVAALALFLASDEASFINGAEYFVDGGAAQY